MSRFLDNFIGGLAFGMMANNPFFMRMNCCYFGNNYQNIDIVDFGTFANPFPAVEGGNYVEQPSIFTTFANPFPTINFSGIGQTIWDNVTNPDSEYYKKMREYYEQISKQNNSNSSNQQTYIPQIQFPFSSFYMPTQITMNPYISGWFGQTTSQYVEEKKDNTDNQSSNRSNLNKYNDKRFNKFLEIVLEREGGYSNNQSDRGGETNKGVTHGTYDDYRKSKGLATQSVAKMTDDEMQEIYYELYYKASGADKIADKKFALYVFDTAVNMGVERAKEFLNTSGGDIDKFETLRKNKYKSIIEHDKSQKENEDGWNNRMIAIKNAANNKLNTIA